LDIRCVFNIPAAALQARHYIESSNLNDDTYAPLDELDWVRD
jgi:hypothetical protein